MMEDNAAVNPDSVAYATNAKVMGAIKKLKTSPSSSLAER